MSDLRTRAVALLTCTNWLLALIAFFTGFLSYDGIRLEMGGTMADNFKAAVFGAGIGISYYVCGSWLINAVPFTPPAHLWRHFVPVGLILACVIGASSITNLNSLGRDLFVEYARNAYIAAQSIWNDQVVGSAHRLAGLETLLTSNAESIRVTARQEESTARVSGGLVGCGHVCLSLHGLADRVEAQIPVLRSGVAEIEPLIAEINDGVTAMRQALTIDDPEKRRVALEAANDEARGHALALRETLPLTAMRAIADELRSGSAIPPVSNPDQMEGYRWVRGVLRDQGQALHDALTPITEDLAEEPPVYREKNGFQLALEVGFEASPSLFLAAIGIDLMTPIIGLILVGLVRALDYPDAGRGADGWPQAGSPASSGPPRLPHDGGSSAEAFTLGAQLMREAMERAFELGRQNAIPPAAIEANRVADATAPTDNDHPTSTSVTTPPAEAAASDTVAPNGHDFGGPFPNAAQSRAQTLARRRAARKEAADD